MKPKQKAESPPKFIKVKPQKFSDAPICIPKLEYKVVAQPVLKTAFTGRTIVMPIVLAFYLRDTEYKVVTVVLKETMDNGTCALNAKQFSTRLAYSLPNIYDTLYNLRRMGILYEYRSGRQVIRAIDFDAVQHLNDLTVNEDDGICRRLRKRLKFKNINNITKDDLKRAYDRYVLPTDHDIEEEEEYD